MSALKLMDQVKKVLAGYDAKVLASLIESIPLRRAALAAVRESRDTFTGKYASTNYAYAQINAVGGKGWMELLRYSNDALKDRLVVSEEAKASARAAKVAAVLSKAGITEVLDGGEEYTTDGYNGWWRVVTDKGVKLVRLTVIGAGGYNIQCYHYRVLTKIVDK